MTAPDPMRTMENRLLHSLDQGLFLGDGRDGAVLAEWMVICGDLPDSTILCDLPVLLGRLSRDGGQADRLSRCGLLPKQGSRPLFFQALAAQVASHARRLADHARDLSGESAPSAFPARIDALRRQGEHLRSQIDGLFDAGYAVEKERERLEESCHRLTATLDKLRAEIADSLDSFLVDRAGAARTLAQLAEAAGLVDRAQALRALPRLAFSPAVAVQPPRDPARPARGRIALA
ncbi:hypothetical protein CKO38_14185, partial [Rhodospirillum rubrum]|uniref:hypothetical protein n=1 Tax=Rhodospirillum rubrum TaxID=1085 RepID=UPI001908347A